MGVAVGGKKKSLSHLHYSNVVPTTTAHEQKNGRKKHGRNNIMKKQDEKQSLTLSIQTWPQRSYYGLQKKKVEKKGRKNMVEIMINKK